MSLFKKYKDAAKDSANKVLDSSMSKLSTLESSFVDAFPYPSLSAASADFVSSATSASNDQVSKCVSLALDALGSMSQDAQTLENFLHLHIPKMEDGNNFGVTVQLAALKQMTEMQEAVTKQVDSLSGYAGARADVLEKLKFPSASKTVSKSSSVTTTDGKKEEKVSESTDEKSEEAVKGPAYESRVAAVVACDTLYYCKAQRALQSTMALYIAALDFMNKNMDKLEKPKGSGGSHSGFSSMY
eukprot:CAMPEP_0176125836 /NCGR_PEP_ID=MMETSP0120_2-20121206/63498_1 /TAXON_ID=160619 /ORGANISM="Kryptoperidinium foliaceum, Strain CCMP 1326" /LENGTH=242 /DNA_ID=CAMNT_0017460729 /DNA_START=55 /DNA_END=783 /DNA_ORIENTATION=+